MLLDKDVYRIERETQNVDNQKKSFPQVGEILPQVGLMTLKMSKNRVKVNQLVNC